MGSGPAPEPSASGIGVILKWGLAAVVVALVVEGVDQFNHRAAVLLAITVLLLVLITRAELLGSFMGSSPIVGQYSRSGDPLAGKGLTRSWDTRSGPH
jgi:hypothetical protein